MLSADDCYPWLAGDPRLAIVEAAADAYRDDLVMPAAEVLDALEDGLTAEEWALRFGLPWRVLAGRVERVLRLWAA